MYLFEAHYYNTITEKESTLPIEFDGDNFFSTEKECYIYAMERAYDMKKDGENLLSLDFISC